MHGVCVCVCVCVCVYVCSVCVCVCVCVWEWVCVRVYYVKQPEGLCQVLCKLFHSYLINDACGTNLYPMQIGNRHWVSHKLAWWSFI